MQNNAVNLTTDLVATMIAHNITSINGFETVTDEVAYKKYLATDEFAETEASAAESGYYSQCWHWDSVRAIFQSERSIKKSFNIFDNSLYVADYVQETPWAYTAYVRDRHRMAIPLWRVKKQGSTLAAEDSSLTEEQKAEIAQILVQYGCPHKDTVKRHQKRQETGWEDDEE